MRVAFRSVKVVNGLLLAFLLSSCVQRNLEDVSEQHGFKHIILFIGDSMGYNHVLATRYYLYGDTEQRLDFEKFPVTLSVDTSQYGETYDPALSYQDFAYLTQNPTDSAAASTAMATGIKTDNGKIGIGHDMSILSNAVEYYENRNYLTGVVTSVPFSHATPAGFSAHVSSRSSYQAIASQMIYASGLDLIMGTGHPLYDDNGALRTTPSYTYVGSSDIWNELALGTAGNDANGDGIFNAWKLIDTKGGFDSLARGELSGRIIGIAPVYQMLQEKLTGAVNAAVPSLTDMSLGAVRLFADSGENFFLVIEGGAIDFASHDNNLSRMIEELTDFDNAVAGVIDFIDSSFGWDDTLVIVTADHETGYLLGLDS